MFLLNYLLLLIPILVNVAFITLLERKILGYSQLRKGPNKVSMVGLLQPFNDAIKLFSNEIILPFLSNYLKYMFSPMLALIIILSLYILFPFYDCNISFTFSVMFIYMILSMNVYPTLVSGWASNSKYALIGSLRAVAQTVSYEVGLGVMLMFYLFMNYSLNLFYLSLSNIIWMKFAIFFPMAIMLLISCVAETNRTPFDFAEGESELVSGFNIEYGSLGFALIFMAEYASILFMSCIFSMIFLSFSPMSLFLYLWISILFSFWVWIRTTFPRYRYDKLMNLAWKVYLPMSLFLIFYLVMLLLY